MKSLIFAVFLLLTAPSAASAAGVSLVTRDVPLRGGLRTLAASPSEFNMVGVHWQGPGAVSFRTRRVGGGWSRWRPAAPAPEDRPDPGREQSRRGWRIGNPYWTGPSTRLQVRAHGKVTRLRAHYISSHAEKVPLRSISVADSPLILSRLAWGANERIRRGLPDYSAALRFSLVHHTAGSNTYTRAQSAAIVRGIYAYHVRSNGWDDIGYNFLIDKYGQVFEGRFGGVDRNVEGAHAQGFNEGSVGVAVIGNYDASAITANTRAALIRLLSWRLDVAHVDPAGISSWASTGNPRFTAGAPVMLRAVSGHRDTGFTACPGSRLYPELNAISRSVAETGLPKLYAPRVIGVPGGPVRFLARLTEFVPWSVVVTDSTGAVIASGEGEGDFVDWTWDARAVPAGRYSYAIEAGPTVRAATGVIAGTAKGSALTALARPALITPNGDGRGESTTVRYQLTAPALVTATVVDSAAAPLGTLFTAQKPRGKHEFKWTAAGIPDGRYGILISARNDLGIESTATVTVIVNRTLAALRVVPQVFSPNGDGRWDTTKFRFLLYGPARVSLVIRRRGKTLGEVFNGRREGGPQAIEWNGAFTSRLGQAEYSVVVRATSTVSTVGQTMEFAIDMAPPRVKVVSRTEPRLSVNEPATITAVFDGTRTVTIRRLQPGRFALPSGGAFTSLRVVARDFAGNETQPIQVR